MSAPDALALLGALRDAARTPAGRRAIAELAAEIRRVTDEDEGGDMVAAEAARLLSRARRRDRASRRR